MDASRLAGRINLVGPWLKKRFGRPVVKIGLDAGFSCPHRTQDGGGCTFCPPSGSGKGQGNMSISAQMDQGLRRIQARAARSGREPPLALAYFQAYTSTNATAPALAPIFSAALDQQGVAGMIISTRPDCLESSIWELISELAGKTFLWLELGLQSSHEATLKALRRGHGAGAFEAALKEAAKRGIPVAAHVILGLPGEDRGRTNTTARYLARAGVWGVKMHNLMILEGSALAGEYAKGKLSLWSRKEWTRAAAEFLAHLHPGVLIHRVAADPGHDVLLAPDWAGDKQANLTALAAYLEIHDLEQGSLWEKP